MDEKERELLLALADVNESMHELTMGLVSWVWGLSILILFLVAWNLALTAFLVIRTRKP